MTYVLITLIALFAASSILFFREAKKAPLVDSKEPFLYGDYDPNKDETMKK